MKKTWPENPHSFFKIYFGVKYPKTIMAAKTANR